MSAQIRPNRMEVTDRFPMLGFAVRADEPNVNAEVVLATDIGLFQQQNRTSRTAANFYSSREHGNLMVPRGEGVFVVPPEVLARFIGSERLYFGLASGPSSNGGLHVDAVPREGSPFVALRGFTGRTLRRSFGSGRTLSPPLLEWTGDTARPGTEPSNGVQAVNGNGNGHGGGNGYSGGNGANGGIAPAVMAAYDDGFGAMPVLPVLPGDQRQRARRIGGGFGERIGEALDLGLTPQSVDPLLNVLDPQATPAPMGYARSKAANGNGGRGSAVPAPRARAMDGGAAAAIAIGGFVVETIRDSRGDISWDLDQFRGIKHPNDVAPASPGPFRDATTLNLDDWPVWEGVDDISAWFKVDWQYNGNSLGNVRITNIGTNDAVGFSLHVTARIMDDNQVYEGNCAALRLTFHYRFDRSIGSEGIAIREITLYGDGTHAIDGRWLQSSAFAREQRARARTKAADGEVRQAPPPAPRARAMNEAAIAIGGFAVESIRDNRGDISWELDQFRGIKHPNDVAPANPGPFRDAPTINLDDWPVWEGIDDISAWFKVDWQYNGNSLGNVRITNTGTNDAVGFSLHVTAKIMDDNQVYEGNCGALRLTFHYRFDRSIGSEGIAIRDITLYGDGTHAIDGRWLQSSAFAREQRARARTKAADSTGVRQAPAPAPRARAMNEAAIAIGGFAVESIRDNRGDISWELDQFRGIKHPNDVAPASPGPFRDAPTINLDDWPIWEGVDDISAWFKIDWQYNGNSLGNVRITNTGTNDAVGFSLHVTAKIMDDNQVYEGNCGALRLTFHYRFDRSIGSEGIAIRDITLYGDGTHAIDGRWLQSSAFAREQRARARTKAADPNGVRQAPAPAPRARAMDGGAAAAIAIGGFIVETIRDSRGDISWDLDQFRGIKHPNDVVPASPGAFRDAPTINLDDWPVWEGIDDISAWFKIDWQYNGNSLGNVRVTNTGTNDAVGFSLHVTAKIMDDNQVYEGNCAALRLTFHYRFDRSIGSEGIAIRDVTLYGDGTHAIDGRWLQSSAFAHQQARSARDQRTRSARA